MIKDTILAPIRKTKGYLKKDAMLLYKRKKYLYIFIALPIVIAMLFLFVLNPSGYNIKIGVCDNDNTEISQAAFSNLNGFQAEIITSQNCIEEVKEKISQGKYDLGIEVPKGFSNNLENLKQSRLIVYYDDTDIAFSNLIAWKVDQSLAPFERAIIDKANTQLTSKATQAGKTYDKLSSSIDLSFLALDETRQELKNVEELDTEFITNPIWTDKKPIYEEDLKKDAGIVFIFPILALFIILMIASTSIIYDKNTNFLTRVKSTSSILNYLFSKTIFFTALVLIQFILILILFMLYGGKHSFPLIGIIQLILFVGLTNTLLGFIIGLISNNEGIAVLFSLIISLPLMLISGIIFPLQALPTFVRWLAQIMPLHYQINASKTVLLFGQQLNWNFLIALLIMFIIVLWLIKKD